MRNSCPLFALLLAVSILFSSCTRYEEFTLPVLQPAAGNMVVEWKVNPLPVIANGESREWDAVDALNPSVVRSPSGYLNFYSGYDGRTWHTGLAISPDGLVWTKHGRIMSPDPETWEGKYIAANGSVLLRGDEYWHWYQAGDGAPQIGLARSKNGRDWTKLPEPVLQTGPRGSWDERGVADPYVVRFGDTLYMYYLGQDRARRQRLGVARSSDGIEWHKLRSNPILELGEPGAFDETGLGEPAVWQSGGSYWMLYTARDPKEVRRLGLARSQNGIQWSRVSEQAVLAGDQPWNSKVVCDPHVEVEGDTIRVWFGGGNKAAPAENLDGQIGVATLNLTPAMTSR